MRGSGDVTGRGDPAQPPREHRLSLPSFGISLPTPPGWKPVSERVGSIGSLLLAAWTRPGTPERAEATIVLALANPKAFEELPAHVHAEPATVDGKPALKLTRAKAPNTREGHAGMWGLGEGFVEGYRLQAHKLYFYLLLSSKRPDERDRQTLRAMVAGWRWLTPVPAHEALALSGRLKRVWHDAALWFDVPYPFVNNPFRGSFYMPYALVEADGAGDAHFEVDALDASDTIAARQAARDEPGYYGTRGWDFAWRELSREPEVHVGATEPSPLNSEGTMRLHKAIVARAPDGRYFRILFRIRGRDRHVMKAYEAIADDVADSITTVRPPRGDQEDIPE